MLRDRNTVAMVAEHWGCSARTVRRLIDAGELSCLRIGSVVRLSREQVEECEAAHTIAAERAREHAKNFAERYVLERAVQRHRRAQPRKVDEAETKRSFADSDTLQAVAQRWGCTIGAVEWQIGKGALKYMRVGSAVRFQRSDVEECEAGFVKSGKWPGGARNRKPRTRKPDAD